MGGMCLAWNDANSDASAVSNAYANSDSFAVSSSDTYLNSDGTSYGGVIGQG